MIPELTSPEIDAPAESSNRIRWFELVLVLFVAFGNSVVTSIYAVLSRTSLYAGSNTKAHV